MQLHRSLAPCHWCCKVAKGDSCKYCGAICKRHGLVCARCRKQKTKHKCPGCNGPYWPSKKSCVICIKVTGEITNVCKDCGGNNFEISGGWSYKTLCKACDRRACRSGRCDNCNKPVHSLDGETFCTSCKFPGSLQVTLIGPDNRERSVFVPPRLKVAGTQVGHLRPGDRVYRVGIRSWLSGLPRIKTIHRRCEDCGSKFPARSTNPKFCAGCTLERRRIKSRARFKKIVAPRGRTCKHCKRNDSETPFTKDTECHRCNERARQNGRCVVCQSAIYADGTCRSCEQAALTAGTELAKATA